MPLSLIKLIAGLAFLGVLLKSLQRFFHGKQFQMEAFFTFIIDMSGVNFLGSQSPGSAIAIFRIVENIGCEMFFIMVH